MVALPQVNFVDKVPFCTLFASPTCAKRLMGQNAALIESALFVNKRYAVSKLYQIITKVSHRFDIFILLLLKSDFRMVL